MSDQNQMPEITESMKRLLQEVRKHPFSPREMTFFSVEEIIGRYENPTTVLLRFFMGPDEGHDLGPIFLRAIFACMKIDDSELRFEGVQAQTQVQTKDGKRIDLLISGRDWVLIIENKIDAPTNNLLTSYENHAKQYSPDKEIHLAILSPHGQAVTVFPLWKGVSYQEYCNALKHEFAKAVFDRPISKWQVFAREFILHLENQLYPTMTMTLEQTAFVEANLRDIGDLKKLSDCYNKDRQRELSERVQMAFPGFPLQFNDNRSLRLESQTAFIGELRLLFGFWTPAHESGNPERMFVIAAWVKGLTASQRQRASDLFAKGAEEDCTGHWVGRRSFANRSEAVVALSELAKELFDLWGNEPPALPPAETPA